MTRLVGFRFAIAALTIAPFAASAQDGLQSTLPCSANAPDKRQVAASPLVGAFAADVARLSPQQLDGRWNELTAGGTPLIERDARVTACATVTFLYRDAAADSVRLVSGASAWLDSLNRLDRVPGSDVWYRTVSVPSDARFGYQFRVVRTSGIGAVNPELVLDAFNARVDSGLGRRSVFAGDAAAARWVEPRNDVPHGRVERVGVRLSGRDTAQVIWVYTPPGYDPARGDAAPLLALFDGGAYVAANIVGTPAILDNLIAERRIVPVVVLFLPQEVTPAARQATMGNDAAYAKMIAEEAIPWVQAHYRVTRDPARIVIGGSSLGGLAASYVALHYPHVVRNVLSQSGSYQWGAPGRAEPEWLTRQLESLPTAPVRFYLEAGTFEMGAPPGGLTLVAANRRFRDALEARGYKVTHREVHGGHEYLSWRVTMAEPLQLFFGRVP